MSQQQQALAELGWRTFNFFNLEPVQDPADPTKKATILQVYLSVNNTGT
jgi:hypothetical protein